MDLTFYILRLVEWDSNPQPSDCEPSLNPNLSPFVASFLKDLKVLNKRPQKHAFSH